jgi:hypothetical protein
MSSQFAERTVKFINKDFLGFKRDLIRFSQAHHSGVFQDFNEAAPGMAILELQAAIGDSLAFYMDYSFNELKQETARQIDNVASFAVSKGYRPQGKAAARCVQSFMIEVPATNLRGAAVPDDTYAPTMLMGSKVQGPNGVFFETVDDLNFATSSIDSPRYITGSKFDSVSGIPTHFAIKKDVEVIAGQTITETFSIGDFQPFKELELGSEDVLEILSVTDTDSNTWYEVDYLARDTIFDATVNTDDDNDTVPFVLKLVPAPRRFITQRNVTTNKTKLVFGSGDGVNFDDDLVPNLADLALPLAGRRTFSSYALDPQNFLRTRSLGLSPYNTTITVRYRVGGGEETNVPAGSIDTPAEVSFDFSTTSLDAAKKARVISSLETMNVKRSNGGGPAESISEIKANSDAFFAAQDRCVVREDYVARVKSLPAKFGKPFKVYAKKTNDLINVNSVDIHVLTKDADGHLTQASTTLMNNIRTYVSRYSGLNVGVNILRADIINLKLEFGIVVAPKLNRTEVLTKCLAVARDYLHVDKYEVGQPIVLSDLSAELQKVYGVISVYKLQFKNIFCPQQDDQGYSTTRFDVRANTANSILYCPQNAVFEVKFPSKDIVGEAK